MRLRTIWMQWKLTKFVACSRRGPGRDVRAMRGASFGVVCFGTVLVPLDSWLCCQRSFVLSLFDWFGSCSDITVRLGCRGRPTQQSIGRVNNNQRPVRFGCRSGLSEGDAGLYPSLSWCLGTKARHRSHNNPWTPRGRQLVRMQQQSTSHSAWNNNLLVSDDSWSEREKNQLEKSWRELVGL